MTWITDERQRQQSDLARTIANYVCANKATLRYQMVAVWDRILDAIDSDVLQLNAVGKQLIVEHGPPMIQVRRENEIAPLFMLEVDLTKGRLRSCPLPPRTIWNTRYRGISDAGRSQRN
jgi:hypothetical protein